MENNATLKVSPPLAPNKPTSIVVVSPHRGDAAFSLALSIGAWRRDRHPVTIVNVFTRSLHAPYSDSESLHENDRLSYVSAMRKREDEAFLRQVPGTTMVDLNIKDAPLRLHCSPAIVRDRPIDPKDGAFPKIIRSLTRQIALGDVALVLPLALDRHVDHRVARDASLTLTAHLPCAFYEDLSYPTTEVLPIDPTVLPHEHLTPVVCPHASTIAWKRKVILGYSSQIEEEAADALTNFAQRYQGTERIWANEAFLATVNTKHFATP